MAEEVVREQLIVKGDVQGVGFRYRAKYAASALGVTGWVRNEWDGSVHMEVQGSRRQIDEMLVEIGQGHFINIDSIDRKKLPLVEYERSFSVKH